jgi:hypothetical protein
VVVAIGLTIGSNVDNLMPIALFLESAYKPVSKVLSTRKQTLKGNGMGYEIIVEK